MPTNVVQVRGFFSADAIGGAAELTTSGSGSPFCSRRSARRSAEESPTSLRVNPRYGVVSGIDASALLERERVGPVDDTNTSAPSRVRRSSYTFQVSDSVLNSVTKVSPSSDIAGSRTSFRPASAVLMSVASVAAIPRPLRTSRPAADAAIPCKKSRRSIDIVKTSISDSAPRSLSTSTPPACYRVPGLL